MTARKTRRTRGAPQENPDPWLTRRRCAWDLCMASPLFVRLRWQCVALGPAGVNTLGPLRECALSLLGGEEMADAVARLVELECRESDIPY